jgi:hypothetical protein
MQQYLFRGKRKDNGEWVTGSLTVEYDGTCHINYWVSKLLEPENNYWELVSEMVEILPKTDGIWIGWLDWLGAKVFTGDKILIAWDHGEESVETISYSEEYGYFMYGNNPICELKDPERIFTVVGNIHDVNPAAKEQL